MPWSVQQATEATDLLRATESYRPTKDPIVVTLLITNETENTIVKLPIVLFFVITGTIGDPLKTLLKFVCD